MCATSALRIFCFYVLNGKSGNQILQSDEIEITSIMENDQTSFSNIKSCEHGHVLLKVQCSWSGITVYKISNS